MKRKRWILPIGILAAAFGLVMAVFIVRASADDLLHQSARLLANATDGYVAFTFDVRTSEKSAIGSAEVWGQKDVGPNGEPAFRLVIDEELQGDMAEAAGMVVVSDGSQVSIWKPTENTVYVGTFAELKERMQEYKGSYDGEHNFEHPEAGEEDWPETPEEAVNKLLEYFKAERLEMADIADMTANHVRLIPIPEMMPDEFRAAGGFFNVWLRTDDSALLAVEYAEGSVGYGLVSVTDLELNQGVESTMFTFTIPEGAEVVDMADFEPPPSLSAVEADAAAGFDVLIPEELPAAARLEGISEIRGAIVQRYRLPDGQSFTIAQGGQSTSSAPDNENAEVVTVRGVEGWLYSNEDGSRTLLTWNDGQNNFLVGGDLSPETALAIANSLQ